MLKTQTPLAVKFICSFIYSDQNIYKKILNLLKKKYGPIDFESEIIPFNFTKYYEEEMGINLKRRFISFRKLREASSFVPIKLYCVNIEKKFSIKDKRTINIDPGYINEARLVLTTTKDFAHRIYLKKGVFAEVTLCFSKGTFVDFSWTFPDYKTIQYKNIFTKIRNIYRENMKK
jgi:Domain of unknown function (DUF4416)